MALITFINTKSLEQIQSIVNLGDFIWREHYEPIIGIQQVEYMLDKFQSVPAIYSQIKDGAEYYLIEESQTPVGYLSVQKKKDSLFLSKLYVLGTERGKGIGKKAIDFINKRALELSCNTISLTVNKYNTNSIKAYEKMGFIKIKDAIFDIGEGYIMDDYVMKKEL